MAAAYRTEHFAERPKGWRVRSVKRGSHVVRIGIPPGRRKKGSERLLEILHPKEENNPSCIVSNQAKKNPQELLVFGNPSRKGKNPDAVESFQSFHGRDPEEILRPQVSTITRKEYWAIGPLLALGLDDFGWTTKKIVDHWDQLPSVYFLDNDGVKLAAAPPEKGETKSRQLYVIGGNQDMASQLRKWEGIDPKKDLIDLGDIHFVTYLAQKIHDDYQLTTYTHRLGEETGSFPRLMYDRLRKQLFFIGGEYFIDLNGISPGIEN